MYSVGKIFTPIALKFSHKMDIQFNSEYISVVAYAEFSPIEVPHLIDI
jgi:hypothetical protein